MRISTINIYKYTLPLKRPLLLKGHSLKERSGIIIEVISEQGVHGFGEIAPLPYFSRESAADALKQAEKMEAYLRGEDLPPGLHKLEGAFQGWLGGLKLYPSVQFGIEAATLNMMANARNVVLSHLLSEETHDKISINGLLQGNLAEVTEQAHQLRLEGFTAMKLKVGNNLEEDITKVKAINAILDGKAILHLDANQSWDIDTAIAFGNEIGCAAVDYIEEPLESPESIPHFFETTLIPVALDESLHRLDFKEIQAIEGVDVLVLKPTLVGGIEKTWGLINAAGRQAIEVVISSSFESSIGILTLANLAGGCTTRDRNAGLDTLKWFEKDLIKDKIVFEHGKLDISKKKITESDVNFQLLEKV